MSETHSEVYRYLAKFSRPSIKAGALVLKGACTALTNSSIPTRLAFVLGQITGFQGHFTLFSNIASGAIARETCVFCHHAGSMSTALVSTWLY